MKKTFENSPQKRTQNDSIYIQNDKDPQTKFEPQDPQKKFEPQQSPQKPQPFQIKRLFSNQSEVQYENTINSPGLRKSQNRKLSSLILQNDEQITLTTQQKVTKNTAHFNIRKKALYEDELSVYFKTYYQGLTEFYKDNLIIDLDGFIKILIGIIPKLTFRGSSLQFVRGFRHRRQTHRARDSPPRTRRNR